ncbi:G protein-coupled receptor family protein [Skeletonema marinoi]|uniref:G protein-coupled receptor family protein n=1 Tax=Skeletonema marinoi TaxID=267567 RepID=A0AAD8YM62_9STRA|nr:G protein-coupled receptor family protein [Skeletonema marinoi]
MSSPADLSLFFLQKLACILSAVGSLMIISQVTRSQFNRKKTQQRLMLCISIIDFQTSIVWIFTPLFMPAYSGYPWSVGNRASCDTQGFIVQFSSAGFLYMCCLQFMYLLMIKYGWKEREITKLEKWFHIIPNAFGIVTATTALVLKQYNAANWDCWIAPLPADCTSSYEVNKGNTELTETDCIRGDMANIFRFAFFFAPLWASILFCIVTMIVVHRTMKKSELNFQKKYRFSQNSRNRQVSDEVKKQSIRYSLAFFIVWTFPTLARIVQFFKEVHPVLVVLSGTTIGLQGFFNALIYFRPRYAKCVKHKRWYNKVWALVHSTIFFCCYNDDYTKDSVDYVGRTSSVINTEGTSMSMTAKSMGPQQIVGYPEGKDEEKREEKDDEWHSNGEEGDATTQVKWTSETQG